MLSEEFRSFVVMGDYDIWWHNRVGQWIKEDHAVPRQGLFSAIGATRPWAAYSWGFEVVMASLNTALGLMGILVFVVAFQMALVLAIFLMTRFLSRSFWWAWLLSALAVWALDVNVINLGLPADFSILFFTLHLFLIFLAPNTPTLLHLYHFPCLL